MVVRTCVREGTSPCTLPRPPPSPKDAPGSSGDLSALADAELEERICTWAGRLAAATAEFLRLLGEFEAREGWAGPGIRSCAHWLSWRCGMSLHTARDHVRVARRLRPLPVTAASFAEGRLSYSKVRAICRVATPGTESDLVDLALSATASHVERVVRALPTADPDQGSVDDRSERRGPERDTRWRWRTDEETGCTYVGGWLEPEDAAAVLAVLRATAAERARVRASKPASDLVGSDGDRTAEGGPDHDAVQEEPDVRGVEDVGSGSFSSAVIVDAFAAAVQGLAAAADEAEGSGIGAVVGRPRAEVVVHVDADLLARLRETATADGEADGTAAEQAAGEPGRALARRHVEDGPALSLAAIERLACEGGVRLATHGSDGRTLDLGRRSHRPSDRQLRVLAQRDHGCTVPGCGRTTLDNLLLLCGEHHRALHEEAFTIESLGRQRFRFRHPSGAVIEYAHIDGQTLTPTWNGERLTADGLGVLADAYWHRRAAESAADRTCLAA